MSTTAALILFLGIMAYTVFGGADFGAGFWDLVAGGTERGDRPRRVIDHSIGPVWEANHVWLIFCFVVLWTCFPEAYASITLTLFVPLAIAALGIVLRGSGLRVPSRRAAHPRPADVRRPRSRRPRCWSRTASAPSSGASRRVGCRPAARPGDPVDSWINPTSILGGVMAVTVGAFLAATYLVWDAKRLDEEPMVEYFRRRAVGAAVVAGVVSLVGIFVLKADAEYLFHGLTSRALPLVILSALCGSTALFLLTRASHKGARLAAIAAVASIVVGWGVAQWEYILPETLTVDQAAAPSGTIGAVIVAVVFAVLLIVPAFALLYRLDQKGLLPEEGVD